MGLVLWAVTLLGGGLIGYTVGKKPSPPPTPPAPPGTSGAPRVWFP